MTPEPETRFFAALAAALADRLGPDHPAVGLAEAARGGHPLAAAEAQRALAELGQAEREAVLAETHRRLREDIAAIWDLLPHAGATTGRRQN